MGESSKAAVFRVAQATFEGLAPLLIESGITSPEVEGLLRSVCVHEAARAQGIGRTNVSRISVKTGVDRHTVADLLRSPPSIESALTTRRDSTSRVVDGWLSDPEYTIRASPQELEIGDPNSRGRNVWNLVRRYAPGVWPRLIIDEMIRVDYVETLPSGKLRLKRRTTLKGPPKDAGRVGSSQRMRDAIRALYRDTTQSEARRTWRTAQSVEIGEEDLPLVRKMLRDRLDSMFAWLTEELDSARWRREGPKEGVRARVGLSGFTFEETLPKDVGNETREKVRRAR
jgi:hypothetical protein